MIAPEDQGSYNTCYIFSAYTSLETTLEYNYNLYYDFSVMQAEYQTLKKFGGMRDTFNEGGNFQMIADYLLQGSGPSLTEDIPYRTYSDEEVNSWSPDNTINVSDYVLFPSLDKYSISYSVDTLKSFRKLVKEHLMTEGALSAAIYVGDESESIISKSTLSNDDGEYDNVLLYKRQTSNTKNSNHAISIIGWDDNYAKENFPANNRPTANGAYLILNSWGSTYSYIWVSYEDIWIENEIRGFDKENLSDNTTYNEYNVANDSSDTLHTIYLGNKYQKTNTNTETINEIIIPMVVLNSSQKASATIYVNPADDSFTKSKLINVGSISDVDHDGLVKLKLVNPLKIEGTSFSVVVEMTSVYTSRTIYSGASSYVSDSLDNEFETFHDLSTSESAVFPITINTDTTNEYYINTLELNHSNLLSLNKGEIYRILLQTNKTNNNNSNINVEIYKNNVNVNSNFDVNGIAIYENESLLRIKPHDNINVGYYKIKITYEDSDPIYQGINIINDDYKMFPNLFSNIYKINYTYISDIKENTNTLTFPNNFSISDNYSLYLYNDNDELLENSTIKTGTKTKYFDEQNNLVEEFTNVVNGDNNSNGRIDIGDIVRIANTIIYNNENEANVNNPSYTPKTLFDSSYKIIAADVNHNNRVDIGDLVKTTNYLIYQNEVENGRKVENPIKL